MKSVKVKVLILFILILFHLAVLSCSKSQEISIYDQITTFIDDDNLVQLRNFMSNNSDLEYTNSYNRLSLLSYSIEKGRFKIAEYLIASGADVNFRDINGITPLHVTVMKLRSSDDRSKFVKLLITNGANVNVFDKIRLQTPLHIAVPKDDIDVVKELITAGAKAKKRDIFRKSPMSYAKELGEDDIYNFLKK
jgi:ankyrin repeat protein